MVGPWYALDARTRNDKDTKNGTTDGRALPDHVTKLQMNALWNGCRTGAVGWKG